MICFLDIDGVICLNGEKLELGLISNLNTLLDHDPRIEVVFNTAWNSNSLDWMKAKFVEAGFRHPDRLIGQTLGTSGGGGLVRSWLRDHAQTGTPYLLIDDSTHGYGMMWGRLIHCRLETGFDEARLEAAKALVDRAITVEGERRALLVNLSLEVARLMDETPWLTAAQRLETVSTTVALWARASYTLGSSLMHEILLVTP
jgi:HAD domain in Swiss Army Knife RNA repair proteins